eukprot:391950_1
MGNGMGMGGMPGMGGWMTGSPMILGPGPHGAMGGLTDIDYAFGDHPHGAPHGILGAVGALLGRRHLMGDEDKEDIRLKKCTWISDNEEICAIFYYVNDVLGLEYNRIMKGKQKKRKMRSKEGEYVKGHVWMVGALDKKECNDNILEYLEYTVCAQQVKSDIFVWIMEDGADDMPIQTINLMKDIAWDKIYDINHGDAIKLCRSIQMIEICFEVTINHKQTMQITTER